MFERILVALHDRENIGASLEKAAQLEHFTGAQITIAQTVWDAVSEEPAHHFPQEEIDSVTSRMKAAELNNLSARVAEFRQNVAELETQVLWSKHYSDAIARYALETRADLIVAPRHGEELRERLILPEALKLTAHARTPLLLANDRPWPDHVNVMVALDVLTDSHAQVNDRMIDFSQDLARALGGDLHLVNVDPVSTSSAMAVETLDEFHKRSRQSRTQALATLADRHPFDYAGLDVVDGEIDAVLQNLAEANGISILVVGTAGRSGLKRLFVGNTAETLLHRLTEIDLVMIPCEPG